MSNCGRPRERVVRWLPGFGRGVEGVEAGGPEVMRRRFHDGVMTLALPAPLFQRAEREAHDSVLQTPGWKGLKREAHGRGTARD